MAALIVSVCALAASPSVSQATTGQNSDALQKRTTFKDKASCVKAKRGQVGCLAIKRSFYVNGMLQHAVAPMAGTSFGANALRRAYRITSVGARYKVIAIVDAMHSGSAYADVSAYRKMYALPGIEQCGTDGVQLTAVPSGKSPCFMQVNQEGVVDQSNQTTDEGWAQEIALDIEMASAVCPHCSILLVESRTANFSDLNRAVQTAGNFSGVTAISNSYGGPDVNSSKQPAFAAAAAKGIAVVASSGDSGYGVSAPASFPSVIGVGGTSLYTDSGYNWAGEEAWSSGGSGCSAQNPSAVWQQTTVTACPGKSVVDVAAVADPATGVSVAFEGQWYSFGGTSASAPIVASLFGMRSDFGNDPGAYLWTKRKSLHDITTGSNGKCSPLVFCTSGTGFDGPTGWGSPSGMSAF